MFIHFMIFLQLFIKSVTVKDNNAMALNALKKLIIKIMIKI